MKNTVIIKGNRYGISIVLNKDLEFSELLKDLESKLEGAEEFFDSDKQLAVTFEGRNLSNEELDEILSVIKKNSRLNIQYVMEENSELETTFFDIIQTAKESETPVAEISDTPIEVSGILDTMQKTNQPVSKDEPVADHDNAGMFYKGTLRSGQTLESKESLVIIGDVNPGATVIAGGNIVIIGTLKGNVTAGSNGNTNAFVMALSMDPIQIQIADVIARSPDAKKHSKQKQEAMIATIVDDQICIESVSKAAIQDINF
ncbi:MAG: septum site-determining protein MinC [Lachnospiraceae bacterium]|nr:septum site-determining protein MinC [Lachnospiraceae bacterium]